MDGRTKWMHDAVRANQWSCLMDGQRSLVGLVCRLFAKRRPRRNPGLAPLRSNTCGRLRTCFTNEGSTEASKFVRDRILRLLHGEVGLRNPAGLRQMGTKRKLPAKKQAALDRVCNYLDGNRHRMCYDEYLEAGYPIASGRDRGSVPPSGQGSNGEVVACDGQLTAPKPCSISAVPRVNGPMARLL